MTKMRQDNIRAIRTLLEYARAKFKLKRADVAAELGISVKDLSNFFAGSAPKIHHPIYVFIEQYFEQRRTDLDPWIFPVLDHLYPDTGRQSPPLAQQRRDFLEQVIPKRPDIDPKDIKSFCSKYSGRYRFVRYAAQLKDSPATKYKEYGMLRGFFEITPYTPNAPNSLPQFTGFFRGRDQDYNTPPHRQSGYILPIGDHFFCIGFEEDSGYPVYISAKLQKFRIQQYFSAFITRRHTSGHLFTSRALFIRDARPEVAIEKISDISYVQPDKIQESFPDIPDVDSLLRNTVSRDGRSVLFLKSPGEDEIG